jgi:hypothetical protein
VLRAGTHYLVADPLELYSGEVGEPAFEELLGAFAALQEVVTPARARIRMKGTPKVEPKSLRERFDRFLALLLRATISRDVARVDVDDDQVSPETNPQIVSL